MGMEMGSVAVVVTYESQLVRCITSTRRPVIGKYSGSSTCGRPTSGFKRHVGLQMSIGRRRNVGGLIVQWQCDHCTVPRRH